MIRIGITGACGFVGSNMIQELIKNNYDVIAYTTNSTKIKLKSEQNIIYKDYSRLFEDFEYNTLKMCDAFIIAHGVAHTNIKHEIQSAYKTNYLDVVRIASSCSQAGVKKLIFVSSAGAYSEADCSDDPINLMQLKSLAEKKLNEIFGGSQNLIVLKPVLMYGKGMKGSLKTLQKLSNSKLPLPIKNITTKRSYLSVKSFSMLVRICIETEVLKNETFYVSDDDSVSLGDLASVMRKKPSRLITFHVPRFAIKVILKIMGKKSLYDQIYLENVVDLNLIKSATGWKPILNTCRAVRYEL